MHFTNRIIRPPFEKRSKFLQVTSGCSHNKCHFCNYYKNSSYNISSIDEIIKDIKELRDTNSSFRRLWLQSADPLALDTDYLLEIAGYVREYLPFVESIGSYARINNLQDKTVDDLIRLKEEGYNHIVFGLESGDDRLLHWMNKGYSNEDALKQLNKMDKAGMDYTLIFLCGLGGHNYGLEHALRTAQLINNLKAERIMINTLTLLDKTPLYYDESFKEATEKEKLEEIITFIDKLSIDTFIDATHSSNTISFFGLIPKAKSSILEHLEDILKDNSEEQLRRRHQRLQRV